MKQAMQIVFYFICAFLLTSCEKIEGEGPVVTDNRSITGFTGIDLRTSGNVYFEEGTEYKVEVRGQRNIIDVLETFVNDGRLVIKYRNNVRIKSGDNVTVTVTAPQLRNLKVSGSGNMEATDQLEAEDLDLHISGSGNIRLLGLTATELEARVDGSGNIRAGAGTADDAEFTISGSGNIDLPNVQAKRVKTRTTGSGEMKLYATETLNASISGSGHVYYKGNPALQVSVTGSGRVQPL
ncbi:MAG TPA: head GIN domain-containing protein [Chitinophagaceae bacterium]|jgi:translation initiation factor IF-1|nr:head GIN domain-containing protein [Chitinophagaceae bacterium]